MPKAATKDILKKVRQVEIQTRRVVNDIFAGEYKSIFKGRGMEFDEVREYSIGDDIRQIDWNVEPNNDANAFSNNVSNNSASNAWYSEGQRLRSRSRLSAGFSSRRSCRRSALHSERYLGRYSAVNNDRCFARLNCGSAARFQLPAGSHGKAGTVPGSRTGPCEGTVPVFSRAFSARSFSLEATLRIRVHRCPSVVRCPWVPGAEVDHTACLDRIPSLKTMNTRSPQRVNRLPRVAA